jgi:hypothetical protein
MIRFSPRGGIGRHYNLSIRLADCMSKERLCKNCGKEKPVIGRRTCDFCTKELARERSKKHYLEKGHTPYPHECPICHTEFVTFKKSSRFCDICRRGARTETSYEYSYGATGRLVWRHREIAEGVLGKRLLSTETVHHVNGVGTDNRLENLMILSRPMHTKLHKYLEVQKLIFLALGKESVWEDHIEELTKSWFVLNDKEYRTLRELA